MVEQEEIARLKEAAAIVEDLATARALKQLAKYIPEITELATETALHLEKLTSSKVAEAQGLDQVSVSLSTLAGNFDRLVKMLEAEKAKDDELRGLERGTLKKLNTYLDKWL